ncbi:iron chelate uptake ABC transporter family permease subunit [Rhodococcus fascians]|jgi:iron complex transport system permease protein|uniref:FecCD family ABC transporter permease n=1 Tax=Nocardiaceae TaxID=85025 RepID=UPI00050CA2DF|nr:MULTISPECIES: iron chelate uptake ABC transporter family permease subunit [Rhodococcus]KJV02203.1 putative ABC transporter permease protein [Rhodococcus sp. PML026]MBJ7324023.1 iron chelate uptake ABC transporter family permease subunit [Rhodococcus sp. (in: high G+C Gram-positive bacteria)]MBJ7352576.1 iron chelate uptake ABC transporter family permease subunit [Rhodococcus sp. (in: high G+C Gram-positive bacteria)]MBY3795091.1 iron chelate uptake ABC transporter family permease subunit [Rh
MSRTDRGVLVPLLLAGSALLVLSIGVAVTIGPANVSVPDVYRVILTHMGIGSSGVGRIQDGIVWELRLPRTLLAAVCGAGLALCGAIMQSLLRNPLADPFVLGISSGASTGAVLVAVLGVGGGALSLSTGAFAGALLSFVLVMLLAAGAGGGNDRVVLAGVAGTQLFSALTSFIVISSADAEQTRGVLFWLLGSLSGADWTDVVLCGSVALLGMVVCLFNTSALDAFTFGHDAAASLGVPVKWVRILLLVITALITASLVSAAGAIGFVGLVLPHAARFLVGARHRRLLPTTVVIGAIFMVWVDTIARTLFAPQEIPVGVVTALIGVPAFALILFRLRRSR